MEICAAKRHRYRVCKSSLNRRQAIRLTLADQQRNSSVDTVHIEQQRSCICTFLAPALIFTFVNSARRAIFNHRQHIVSVIIVEDGVALIVLPYIGIINGGRANFPLLEIFVHLGFIVTYNFLGILILPASFNTKFAKGIGHTGQLKEFSAGLVVCHSLQHEDIQNVIAAGASTKTPEVVCFLVVNKRGVVLCVERAATLHIALVIISDPQLLNDDTGVFIAKFLFCLHDCIAFNLQWLNTPLSN